MATVKEDRLLDARGLLCPMPLVRTAREIKTLEPGQVLKVLATDHWAIANFQGWARDTGNDLLEWHDEGGGLAFWIRRGEE